MQAGSPKAVHEWRQLPYPWLAWGGIRQNLQPRVHVGARTSPVSPFPRRSSHSGWRHAPFARQCELLYVSGNMNQSCLVVIASLDTWVRLTGHSPSDHQQTATSKNCQSDLPPLHTRYAILMNLRITPTMIIPRRSSKISGFAVSCNFQWSHYGQMVDKRTQIHFLRNAYRGFIPNLT